MRKQIRLCSLMLMFIMALTIFTTTVYGSGSTVKAQYTTATVNVSSLNMRCGPGTEFSIIGVLKKSQAVQVLGQIDGWYVVYDSESGKIGAVSGYYITLVTENSKDDPKLPDETAPNTTEPTPRPDYISDDAQRLLSLVNDIRTRHGAGSLKYSDDLSKVAYDKAKDMVENNYFSHQSEIYGSPFEMMRAYGISFTAAAENIAGNQTIDGAFYAWMNSEGHKKNIMNGNYTETGIGIYTSPIYGKIIVQMFIRR